MSSVNMWQVMLLSFCLIVGLLSFPNWFHASALSSAILLFIPSRLYAIDITKTFIRTYSPTKPYIADAFAEIDSNSITITVIISSLQLPENMSDLSIGVYELNYNGRWLRGKRMIIAKKNCAIVKYGASFAAEFSYARIPVMLRNNATDLFISNCTVGVLPKRRKSGIATCAYLSSYNSFYEAALFVQHTLACGVDKVILYEGTPVDYLPVLKQLYGNRLLLYRFTWPQIDRPYPQLLSQISMINSCYYRHKGQFDYTIMIDIDEMIFNPSGMPLKVLLDSLFSNVTYGIEVSSVFPSYS